tara:strand:+ start:28798 stop:29184 length:387 start_codon:yes stop_codon:yes gene_type:complete
MTIRHHFSPTLFQSSAPFSHVVIAGTIGQVSGLIGQRRDDGGLVGPDIREQLQAIFGNLDALLAEVELSRAAIVSMRVYLLDYVYFEPVNAAFTAYFASPFPARSTLQVAGLPLGALVQVDATLHVAH